MGNFIIDTTPAASCDALLVKANRIYLEIETLYQSMQQDLSVTSILKVMQTVGTLNALLQDAQTIDNLVADTLGTISVLPESTSNLLAERNKIRQKLSQENLHIVSRANNVKSLLQHEITALSTNHNAIKGYKSVGRERRHIIRDSF